MTKLFLSTPCYGGICLEKYMIGVIKLQLLLIREGIQLIIDTTENESLVHRARNVAVGRFMQKSDAEYIMFIDAAVDFDPASVVRQKQEQKFLISIMSALVFFIIANPDTFRITRRLFGKWISSR